jgi:NAD(P)H-dependent FMN reductase
MLSIKVILASTREERRGGQVAKWVMAQLKARTDISVELVDLKDYPLPFIQAEGPDYTLEPVKRWSDKITEGDAYIIVNPEYNHGYPAALKNAIDHLGKELQKKPATFVSYSTGIGAGIRSTEQLRLVLIHFQMVPLLHAVHIPNVEKQFNESGEAIDEFFVKRLKGAVDALIWWGDALKNAKENK